VFIATTHINEVVTSAKYKTMTTNISKQFYNHGRVVLRQLTRAHGKKLTDGFTLPIEK